VLTENFGEDPVEGKLRFTSAFLSTRNEAQGFIGDIAIDENELGSF
jgi:hypothetical protein